MLSNATHPIMLGHHVLPTDIMARVSGVSSNGFKGLCKVENKQPEVSAHDHVILKFY